MTSYVESPSVEGSTCSYDEAIDAFIDGRLVEWGAFKVPDNQRILKRIEQRRRTRVAESAIAHVKGFKSNLTQQQLNIVTALSDEMRTDSKLLDGMLRMLTVIYGYNERQVYEDLAKKHNTFVRKHNDPKSAG